MKEYKFDLENNLVTLSSSILKHFTNVSFNNTNKKLDEILKSKNYRKIALILMDGLSCEIMKEHLSPNDYLLRHVAFQVDAIFPPTTVACTNAILSSKYPSQNAHLGWRQYFAKYNQIFEMFTNINSLTRTKMDPPLLKDRYLGYDSILDIIKQKANVETDILYPDYIKKGGSKNFDDFFVRADKMMKHQNDHFYYMYYPSPDDIIHVNGVHSKKTLNIIKRINQKMQKLASNNKDNLIIFIADHGLVDCSCFDIREHEDFLNTLKTIPSLDARSCIFHVLDNKHKEFEMLFKKYYGDYFILKTKKEVLEEEIFGPKENHSLFESFLGDYLAISTSKYGFCFEDDVLKAHHAGGLKEEYLLNVVILNR